MNVTLLHFGIVISHLKPCQILSYNITCGRYVVYMFLPWVVYKGSLEGNEYQGRKLLVRKLIQVVP